MAAGSAASAAVPPMPWFGMDIGGTLAKLVYFEPTDDLAKLKEGEENAILSNIKLYLTKNKAYGESGHRDAHIQMDNVSEIRKYPVVHNTCMCVSTFEHTNDCFQGDD